MHARTWLTTPFVFATLLVAAPGVAAPELLYETTSRGSFLIVGSPLGVDCSLAEQPLDELGARVAIPPFAAAEACATAYPGEEGRLSAGAADTALDLFLTYVDDTAVADREITPQEAVSGAVLSLPGGASVTHAWLYWAGYLEVEDGLREGDREVELWVPSGDDTTVKELTAAHTLTRANGDYYWYQSYCEVTDAIRSHGPGLYSVSGVDSLASVGAANEDAIAAWWLVTFFDHSDFPVVNVRLYHGLDAVGTETDEEEGAGEASSVKLEVTDLPPRTAGDAAHATLGLAAYEGDALRGGDYVTFNATPLTNELNPERNFFNGTRSAFGESATNALDRPPLSGGVRSLSGLDLDLVALTERSLANSDTAVVEIGSSFDRVLIGGLVTEVAVSVPLIRAEKSVEAPSGRFAPGRLVEYRIDLVNDGSAPAGGLVLEDELPPEVAFVPGSVEVLAQGERTDTAASYSPANHTLTVHLGSGSSATQGGRLDIDEELSVFFQATILSMLPTCTEDPCVVSNQAVLRLAGGSGTEEELLTDGIPETPEPDPTTFELVLGCVDDSDCEAPTGVCLDGTCVGCIEDEHCDGSLVCFDNTCVECATRSDCGGDTPFCVDFSCVECQSDGDCSPLAPQCDSETLTCVCDPAAGCEDSDDDGLPDDFENAIGTDPEDADTDDDGVLDGQEPAPDTDSDGDGLINALDPDSDNDGIGDGTELGVDCSHEDTDPAAHACIPDADEGETTTDPLDPDTDGSGLSDGSEDFNRNGAVDAGETDPGDAADDDELADSDGDGLSDDLEIQLRSDPEDTDTDDDGVPDGSEPNPGLDDDGDGRTSLTDADSDNDGLFDGTELGFDCDGADTDPDAHACIPDADGGRTTTSPVNADTDGGGVSDGSEDYNLDGRINGDETDPNDPSDDESVRDRDNDGLGDELEATLGSDPRDADTDDDGVLDGQEANPSQDLDLDGTIAVRDPDSDGDLLLDGVEVGTRCDNPDTDPHVCILDADLGATVTSPALVDTNGDGTVDGDADLDLNGVVNEADELFADGEVKGGGCACSTQRRDDTPSGLLVGLLLAVVTARRLRRRR